MARATSTIRTFTGSIRCSKRILARDVHHPGACHLYVHATESTIVPGRAEACAEFLGRSIPGASHINHMPSHTWNEVGRWGDSVRANLEAWHSDQKAAIGEGFAIYPEHNLHMLLYAASYDGQGAIAMRAGKDYAKLTGDSFYEVLTLIRFGRFDEVLQVTSRPTAGDPGRRSGTSRRATPTSNRGTPISPASISGASRRRPDSSKAMFRVHTAKNLLGDRGRHPRGRDSADARAISTRRSRPSSRRRARRKRSSTTSRSRCRSRAFHWLGAALVEAKRFAEAEKAYRAELKDHPHNGWSLLGLKQALEGMGQQSSDVSADLASSWSRVGHLDPVVALLSGLASDGVRGQALSPSRA